MEASIGKFSKQIEVCRIDKDRWLCRFKASRQQLAEMKSEIAAMVRCKAFFADYFRPFEMRLKFNENEIRLLLEKSSFTIVHVAQGYRTKEF